MPSQIRVSLIAAAAFAALSLVAQAQDEIFEIEPHHRTRVLSDSGLNVGDVVTVTAERLRDNETVVWYLCQPCNVVTREIASFSSADFEQQPEQQIGIEVVGTYLFTMSAESADGRTSVVRVDSAEYADGSASFIFESGSVVSIAVSRAQTLEGDR